MRLIDADALIQALEKKHAHWHELVTEENKEIEYAHQYAVNVIRNAPIAEPTGDLISREDAIKAIAVAVLDDKDEIEAIKALPSAEAKPTVIQSKTLFPTKDFMEWAKRIKEVNPNAVVIPCDAEVASDEAVQGEWIDIDNYYRLATCSHCHKVTMFEKWGEYTRPYDFCPNCGAKMHKGGEDNNA